MATALVNISDVERIQYENEQRELQHAAPQNVQLAPFCELKKEEESSIDQEWEMTKWEIEQMEKEAEKRKFSEAKKKHIEDQIRISEEEPSIPYDYNNERIIFRDGKKYKQWFQLGFGSYIWYGEEEIACL